MGQFSNSVAAHNRINEVEVNPPGIGYMIDEDGKAITFLRLQLHGAIYLPDSFVLILSYCANLKAIRYESTSFNRIVADKSHHVIVALSYDYRMRFIGYDSIQSRWFISYRFLICTIT